MKIYGHRGASATNPENTLRAFQRAIEAGVEGLEFDVQVTANRVPVVLHDRSLNRTTNGSGDIDAVTFAQLQLLDAGEGERVPSLDEVLTLVGDRVHLDIEIKQFGIEHEVLAVLAAHPDARWAISSFDWTALERLRAISAVIDLWPLAVVVSEALMNCVARLNASGVALYGPSLDAVSAQRLRDAGLHVTIWTVNDPIEAARVRDLGADALCTDVPELMISALVDRSF